MNRENSIQLPIELSANAVQKTSFDASSSSFHESRGGRSNYFQRGRSNRGNIFRGRGRFYRGGRSPYSVFQPESDPPCQICEKYGHKALVCFQRYNQAVQAPPPLSFAAHYSEHSSLNDSL